jgi:electron transfer flavoprotein beta subunit
MRHLVKIIVGVKRVVDFNVHIHVRNDGSGVETGSVKMAMNPFDEIALEEALRIRETSGGEVIAVSIGPDQAKDTIRTALAMGADRGILIQTDVATEPLGVAKLLARVALDEAADLVILGKQAIDDDANQTGQMLAGLLSWPQATFASAVAIHDGRAEVTREIDGGLQIVALPLPAVITADLRLNQPRYASLPNIMKAKQKPLKIVPAGELGIDLAARLTVLNTEAPAARKAGVRVGSVSALIDKLKTEAGVL